MLSLLRPNSTFSNVQYSQYFDKLQQNGNVFLYVSLHLIHKQGKASDDVTMKIRTVTLWEKGDSKQWDKEEVTREEQLRKETK